MECTASIARASGTLRWFDAERGHGFLVPDDGGPDVLIPAGCLRRYGASAPAEGARIVAVVEKAAIGPRATDILALGDAEHTDAARVAPEPLRPARVKWFDRQRAYGFVNLLGDTRDVFLHAETLRRSGMRPPTDGEAVLCRVAHRARGYVVTEIADWSAPAASADAIGGAVPSRP